MMDFRILLVGALVLLAGCVHVHEPTIQTGVNAEIIDGNLHRVENSRAAIAYVDPDADFSRFTHVMVDPLGVDHVEIIQPGRTAATRTTSSDWVLEEKDKQALRDAFAKAMRTQLEEKGDYPIVTEPGGHVLRISAALTAIAPNAPKDDSRSRSVGRSRVYSEGMGTVYISVGFSNSESGEVLALVKDDKEGSSTWGVNNSVANLSEVRFMFNSWARAIRARLDIIHGH